jgi:hypothetical protein
MRRALVAVVLLVGPAASRAGETPSPPKPAAEAEAVPTAEQLADAAKRLGDKAVVTAEGPFIVVSDLSRAEHEQFAKGTVRACYDALNKQYFAKRPTKVIAIYLLGGEESYKRFCRDELGEEPGTPFGFFREDRGMLVMNIRTGGGTLVHEMFHPLVKYDFPAMPAWLNEGMASLYEQCRITPEGLIGLKNWRLPGLVKGMNDGKTRSVEALTALTTAEFYGEGSGLNYAQARYLCMYLQERKLLQKFYRTFRDSAADDPTGIKALKSVVAPQELADFEKEMTAWVLKLSGAAAGPGSGR